MLRQVSHRRCRLILDRCAGFVRFESSSTGIRKKVSGHAKDLFKEFSNTRGLKAISIVWGGGVALVSLSVYLGTYKLSHQMDSCFTQMDSRFDEMDSRFDEIKSILLDQTI